MNIKNLPNSEMLAAVANSPFAPSWTGRIGADAQKFWEQNKLIITQDMYVQERLEFMNALVKRIGLAFVNKLETTNPLAIFNEPEGLQYGSDIEELGVDVIKGHQFQGIDNPQDQFKPSLNAPDAVYHRLNREYQYETSLGDARITQAFLSENGISSLFGQQMKRLYDSDTVDQYIYFKKCFADLLNGKAGMPLRSSQVIEIPDLRDPTIPPEQMRRGILTVKNAVSQASQNFKGFSQMGYTQAVARGSMASVISFAAKNNNTTQNLPLLFNPQYSVVDLEREVEFDNMGDGGEDIIWVICDKRFIQRRDNKKALTNAVNAKSLYVNYFWTHFDIFTASPFKNAIFFIPEGTKKKYAKNLV